MPSFTLTVLISDGQLSITSQITISLLDVNESPELLNESLDVEENSSVGQEVLTLEAVDPEGDDFTFLISSGNENGAFSLNSSTGVLAVADSSLLDFEENPAFSLQISVNDGQLASTTNLSVTVLDVNEVPFLENQSFEIEENSLNEFEVGVLIAEDPENDPLSFSILSGNELGAFDLDNGSGLVSILDSEVLDFETNQSFNL